MPNWWEKEPNVPAQVAEWQRLVSKYQTQIGPTAQPMPAQQQAQPPRALPQQQAQGWQPPGFMDVWQQRLQQPAPAPRPRVLQPAQPAVPSRAASGYVPPIFPPGAPEYATEPEEYERRGAELAGQIFPWFDKPTEGLPEWMQMPEEFIRKATAGGLGRVVRAFERPEDRALLGTQPDLDAEGRPILRPPGDELPSTVSPEDYRVLFDPVARMRAVEAKKEELPKLLQYDPLGIGTALAEVQVGIPAALKWWEHLTERSTAARQVEQFGAVGMALLQEPAIGLEQLTGAAAIIARPESRDLTMEQWYPLTTRTWSLAWDQARHRLGQTFRLSPDPQNADVLGISLGDISSGRATGEQIALAREMIGAELVGQVLADPLNLLDWILAANRAARAQALSASQAKLLTAAADAPQASRALRALEAALETAGDAELGALQAAAAKAGTDIPSGLWGDVRDVVTKPFQLTPEAKAVRDLEDLTVVLAPVLDMAESGDEVIQALRMWADDPASLAPVFGRVPESQAGRKASVVLGAIVDQLEALPSAKAKPFNAARFWVDLDQLAHDALRLAHGYEEPGRIQRFFLAYKRLMSEVYLNAVSSPGYVIRNTLGDSAAMVTDGVMTFEHADDIDNYFAQFGELTTRRMMTEGAASREALTGQGQIRSVFPGVVGRISEKGQEITRFAEPFRRLPLGEESRYKRAVYTALKRFWNENAPGMLPALPDAVRAQLGDEIAEHLHLRLAYEPSLEGRRAALADFLEGTKGQRFEPTRYLDPDDLDAMSPVVLRRLREDLGQLTDENTVEDLRGAIDRVRESVDEAEAARLAEMEDLPARVHVATDVDEAEIADDLVDSLQEVVARTGDEDLARQVEDIKRAIPEVEEQLETARRAVVDDLMTEPAPDGMEILLRANGDVEDLRNSWRQAANRLRQEAKAAYDANPLQADEIWRTYFRAVDEGWSDLASQRIARYQEAGEQLRRLRGGEPLDEILGAGRQQLAEDRLLKASEVPDRPQGFLPGRVLRSDEDAKFEAFLAWHRGKLDSVRTNAWRAVYGAEPEDYGRTLDLLDSAGRDVEQFGKATAGKVRELYRQAEAAAQKSMRMHKSKKMRALAVDAVWERYYILRNDAWNRYWSAAAERWKIAERDVLWGNWSRGPRMEPPAPVPSPRPPAPPEAPPTQAAMPTPAPGDEEIVKAAILKRDADWSDVERKAIERWTKGGQELPEIQPSLFPAAADIPPYTRQQFVEDLKGISGITDEQAGTLTQLTDAAADVWSKRTGRAPEEWYGQYIAGFGDRGPDGLELFQRAEGLDDPPFTAWFRESKVTDEAGKPKVMYHGTKGTGFEAFDVGKADPQAMYGPGFYFTDSAPVASGYASTKGGAFQFAAEPQTLMPQIRAAAEAAEHPEVRSAREVVDRMTERWEGWVAEHPGPYSPADQEALNLLEREFNEKIRHLRDQEKLYGDSPVFVQWDMFFEEGPETLDQLFRRYGMDPAGIIDQLGAPGVYPTYLSIQRPFDIDTMFDVEEASMITGRPLRQMRPLTTHYSGDQIYDMLKTRAITESQGLPTNEWVNRKLASLGYDGIAHTGGKIMGGEPHQVFIAFDPQQVKSIFNKGDWSSARPQLLYQNAGMGAKGAVDFLEDGRAMFSFFEGADISTGLHEIGHVFRRTLPESDLRIVEMWAELGAGEYESLYTVATEHQWLAGLPRRSAAQEERMNKIASAAQRYEVAEEKFARGFERYLAEGKAPTPELAGVFEKFKRWLIDIYRKIVGSSLDVDLNDKIRGVMDRLLAENPVPRAGDPFGKEVLDIAQARQREQVASAISGYRHRAPLDIDDARQLYQTEDPQALARALEQQAQEYEQLASREALRDLAHKRTHAGRPAGYEGMGHRWQFGEAVDIQSWRTASKKTQADLYWDIQGIDPSLPTSEKVKQANRLLKERKELADWYYTLAMQAQDLAAGKAPGTLATTIPEAAARQSLESIEAYENLRELDNLDGLLEELGFRRADIFPGEAPPEIPGWAEGIEEGVAPPGATLYQRGKERPERIDPNLARRAMGKAEKRTHVWTAYIQEHYRATGDLAPGADARDLYAWLEQNMPEALEKITAKPKAAAAQPFRPFPGKQYQTPEGIGTAISVESGRGAKNAWVELPDGTTKQFAFDQLSPAEAPPVARAAAGPERPRLSRTPNGGFYVTNAEGTGGRSFEAGARGKTEAQRYWNEQAELWRERPAPPAAAPPAAGRHVEGAMERALATEPRPISQTAAMRVRTDLTESLMDIDTEIGVSFHQQNDPRINTRLQELVNNAENQRRYGAPDPELDAKLEQLAEFFDLPPADFGETMPMFRPEAAPPTAPPAAAAAPPTFGQPPPGAQPPQMGMFAQGEDLPLFSGTAPRAEGARFAPPQAAAETMLPGMEPAMGDLEKYAARPVEAAAAPPETIYFKGESVQLTGQTEEYYGKTFWQGTYTSGSKAGERVDVADEIVRRQIGRPEQLALGGEEATALEALRPKRKPKGQMTLWQREAAEQTGFWRMDPDNWREYIDAINQPGATAGPLPHEILQRSTDATRRSLDKIEQGMTRDWDQWQEVATDRQAQQALTDWFDNEVTPNWYENRAVAYDYARAQADFSILDYSKRRNLDMWMGYVFPYHYWFTRAGKNWAQRLAKRPGMLANYVRTRDAMKLANQQAGRRQRFEGKVRVPFPWLPDWMGDAVYVDPIGLLAPYSQIFGTDWDDADDSKRGLKGIYSTAQRFGLRPYHIWDYLYKMGAFQKAGELAGMAPGQAKEMLGPKYPRNFPYILPQTGVVKGVTSLAHEMGAEAMPPGGINIEAPLRQALGLPAGEIWDPYRINRMLANLAAEQPQDATLAQAALRAQELVERDTEQTGKVWDPASELAQQTAAELNWTPEQLADAQRLLADAMQKATLERGIGTIGWAAGPGMAIEPRGERAQLEMAEQARATTWSPGQPGGSREAYEQFKRDYPAMYPRSTQYNILPGEKEYEAMPPGARANWLILRQQREMLHDDYDQAIDNLLRAEPWNWSARGELEDQRRAALAGLEAKYPMPEMQGEIPAILFGMNPPEMWNGTAEKELYQMQATKPSPSTFETEEGVDWDAYYKAETKWRAQLPKAFSFGVVQDGMYRSMDPTTAMRNFEQRYDSPLEAAYKLYQQDIASPAWADYNQAKAEEERLFPGAKRLQDQYWDLDQTGRRALLQAHPELKDYWSWKDQRGSAYERTVGRIGAVPAATLIPSILARYEAKGWTEEQLKRELEGVIFPSLSEQQDLKRGKKPQQAAGAAAPATGGGYAATGYGSQYSPGELEYQKRRILRQWNARQGRYSGGRGGGGGGGYRARYGSRYEQQYPRWRPPYMERGGPFAGGGLGAIRGGPFES